MARILLQLCVSSRIPYFDILLEKMLHFPTVLCIFHIDIADGLEYTWSYLIHFGGFYFPLEMYALFVFRWIFMTLTKIVVMYSPVIHGCSKVAMNTSSFRTVSNSFKWRTSFTSTPNKLWYFVIYFDAPDGIVFNKDLIFLIRTLSSRPPHSSEKNLNTDRKWITCNTWFSSESHFIAQITDHTVYSTWIISTRVSQG